MGTGPEHSGRAPVQVFMETGPTAGGESRPPEKKIPKALGFGIRVWARDIALSFLIAAFVIVFLCQPVKVEGTSMLPHLEDEQRIFVSKVSYRFEQIERGDVIVFRFPEDPSRSYIKRVVGLPGDTVEIRRGQVLINGEDYAEPYVPQRFRDHSSRAPVVVADGTYYVLGDHRSTSNDSRSWGTVAENFVTGRAVFAYWPPDRIGVVR